MLPVPRVTFSISTLLGAPRSLHPTRQLLPFLGQHHATTTAATTTTTTPTSRRRTNNMSSQPAILSVGSTERTSNRVTIGDVAARRAVRSWRRNQNTAVAAPAVPGAASVSSSSTCPPRLAHARTDPGCCRSLALTVIGTSAAADDMKAQPRLPPKTVLSLLQVVAVFVVVVPRGISSGQEKSGEGRRGRSVRHRLSCDATSSKRRPASAPGYAQVLQRNPQGPPPCKSSQTAQKYQRNYSCRDESVHESNMARTVNKARGQFKP